MGIKNLGLALAALATLGGAPNKDIKNNPDTSNHSAQTAPEVAGQVNDTHNQAKLAIETMDSDNSPETQKALIIKILQECPDPDAMIAKQDPELHALLKANHPEMLQASVVGGLLSTLYTLVKLLYGVVGAEGTIILIILISVFGLRPVAKTGWKWSKWAVGKASGARPPDELGETIPTKNLPSLNTILGETVADQAIAIAALEPTHRGALNNHYNFVVNQFDSLKFVEQNEGIEMFKLAIKEFYLALRLDEIIAALTGPGAAGLAPAQRAALETELDELVHTESRIIGEIASNPLKIASVGKGKEDTLKASMRRKVADVMGSAGRPAATITEAQEGATAMVTIPRLHKIDSNLREIRILENKLKMLRGRYNHALTIAGPGTARPAGPGATVVAQQEYDRAATFIGIYEGFETTLRDKQDATSRYKKLAYAVERKLPISPTKRTIINLGIAAALIYGGTWGIRGLGAAQDAIWPPEPPAPTKPSEADKMEEKLKKNKADKIKSETLKANDAIRKYNDPAKDKPDPF